MAVRNWTPEQQKVIRLRNRNILVSAAAGSGKTAVLVERILKMITDPEQPVDVDHLLVVTFTRAAAAEMRERIGNALEQELLRVMKEDPENQVLLNRLMNQSTLLHSAQISTIDSFCKKILTEHFHDIDLDPGFRMADEAELLLMRADVCEKLLEDSYEENTPEFREFAEMYATGKSDDYLEELILQMYAFSQSYPDPEKWLADTEKEYERDVTHSRFMELLYDIIGKVQNGAAELNEAAIRICESENGPLAYREALLSDQEWIGQIQKLAAGNADGAGGDGTSAAEIAGGAGGAEAGASETADGAGGTGAGVSETAGGAGGDGTSVFETAAGDSGLYEKYADFFQNVKFTALSRKKQEGVDEEKKELVKSLRDQMKKAVEEVRKSFFFQDISEMEEDYQNTVPGVRQVLRLTAEFTRRFAAEKKRRNMLDFSDLEHLALRVLTDEDGKPTAAAVEYRDYFAEIMIDEYQDSNLIQEILLGSISKEACGKPNMFMVGDVKQSIYKFRQARPELFMKKYGDYSEEDSLYQKIDLHKNFRSRAGVLDFTNLIFRQIMHRSLGGVEYDDAAALYPGAEFPPEEAPAKMQRESSGSAEVPAEMQQESSGSVETPAEVQQESSGSAEAPVQNTGRTGKYDTEILLMAGGEAEEPEAGKNDQTADVRELEAMMIADRILKLRQEGFRYEDCVILLRTMSGWSEVFLQVLTARGIPAVCDTASGYFSAWEVQVMLNLLRVLDNPRQDIPLASVLLSPIGGMTAEELSLLRIEADKEEREDKPDLYEVLCLAKEREADGHAAKFLTWLAEKRHEMIYTPVHELIRKLLSETGFYRYVSAMPAGSGRAANLDMLVEKALGYEQTSYHGLFHFVRYVERLHRYEVDYGEASADAGDEDRVRIMSIHKSKGLEFPVVFVSGMAKKFNQQDSRNSVVLHPDYGIAVDSIDLVKRQKSPTLAKKILQKQLVLENLGEELRVLYVALTRAREKLILTGVLSGDAEKLADRRQKWENQKINELSLMKAGSYLDMVMPVLKEDVREREQSIRIRTVDLGGLFRGEAMEMFQEDQETLQLMQDVSIDGMSMDSRTAPVLSGLIEKELTWRYPYAAAGSMKGKLTVSELKRLHLAEEDAGEALYSGENESSDLMSESSVIPAFAAEETKIAGTARGTLYHRVLEKMPFARVKDMDSLKLFLSEMLEEKQLTEEEEKALNRKKLVKFLQSPLAERMRKAESAGRLRRESPFVLGVPAAEVYPHVTSASEEDVPELNPSGQELILIQGIVDVWFEEEDGIVLVDYKTDRIPDGFPKTGTETSTETDAGAGTEAERQQTAEEFLVDRYRIQLDYYKKALEQLTGKTVKEEIIYSFSLEKAIPLDDK